MSKLTHVSLFSLVLFGYIQCLIPPNNVCKTFEGYYTNKDCYYNPDQVSELPSIVTRHGYQVEEYEVLTEDGYYLKLFRIPSRNKDATPVFLQHGIYASCMSFVITGNSSLAFVLADAGYDVWLGNFRGTRYCRKHSDLKPTEFKFWDFSLHELGIYDTKAMLEFVYKQTQKRIVYIGFSLGTVTGHVYSSVFPDRAKELIKVMISLAPTALLETSTSALKFLGPLLPSIGMIVNSVNHGEVFDRSGLFSSFFNSVCLPYPHQMKMCLGLIQTGFGFSDDQINPETLPITLAQDRDSISMKVVLHQRQIVRSRKFRQFDYGTQKNLELYGSPYPSLYPLSSIKVPNHLIRAKGDLVATEKAVNELYNNFSDEARKYGIYVVDHPNFAHTDFIAGKDVKKLVYDHILEFLTNITNEL